MKKTLTALALILIFGLTAGTGWGMPIGTSPASRDYMITAQSLSHWSAGFYVRSMDRMAERDGFGSSVLQLERGQAMAYIGYDFVPWFTTYLAAGKGTLDLGTMQLADEDFEYGLGMRFNVLDHDILSPTLYEDRVLITASWQYTTSDEFDEFLANVLLHIVNDTEGDKFYIPYSLALYLGPVFSEIIMDNYSVEDQVGVMGGLEVYMDDNIALRFGVEYYDEMAFDGGVHVRF